MKFNTKSFLIGVSVAFIFFASIMGGAIADRIFGIRALDSLIPRSNGVGVEQKLLKEESIVIDVAERVSPSVVTVSVETQARRVLEFDPFQGLRSRIEGGSPQDIGTGFIVSSDGLIVTNKHVVSDTAATYKIITKDNKEYEVQNIARDPKNDLAVLRINASGLTPISLGSSDNLKVGQFVIAIGTALGEFRHTITTGVISGLGRGIVAGSPFEGYIERLDDVIQTDAAINPGNSGGPLLNSVGQVIAVNVAVAQSAQNIGFAIPVNLVKERLAEFEKTGEFEKKAFLGVEHSVISQSSALLNNVPQGAFIISVVPDSPADKAGIDENDIITEIDGQKLEGEEFSLADIIANKSPGERINLKVWRSGETLEITVTLEGVDQ